MSNLTPKVSLLSRDLQGSSNITGLEASGPWFAYVEGDEPESPDVDAVLISDLPNCFACPVAGHEIRFGVDLQLERVSE